MPFPPDVLRTLGAEFATFTPEQASALLELMAVIAEDEFAGALTEIKTVTNPKGFDDTVNLDMALILANLPDGLRFDASDLKTLATLYGISEPTIRQETISLHLIREVSQKGSRLLFQTFSQNIERDLLELAKLAIKPEAVNDTVNEIGIDLRLMEKESIKASIDIGLIVHLLNKLRLNINSVKQTVMDTKSPTYTSIKAFSDFSWELQTWYQIYQPKAKAQKSAQS
jgi:hypothetical protein